MTFENPSYQTENPDTLQQTLNIQNTPNKSGNITVEKLATENGEYFYIPGLNTYFTNQQDAEKIATFSEKIIKFYQEKEFSHPLYVDRAGASKGVTGGPEGEGILWDIYVDNRVKLLGDTVFLTYESAKKNIPGIYPSNAKTYLSQIVEFWNNIINIRKNNASAHKK